MEPERRPVVLVSPDGLNRAGGFLLWEESPEDAGRVRLSIRFDGEEFTRDADDFFSALCSIRVAIASMGLAPRCYGSSRNVHPSGMSRGMGVGDMAYRLYPRRRGRTEDLVNIFEDGPDVDPVSVQVQANSYRDWLESLRT